MSDRQLRELERRYDAGDIAVLLQLLSLRFRISATVENAHALFDYQYRNREPIDLADAHIQYLASLDSAREIIHRLSWVSPTIITIKGYQLQKPDFRMDRRGLENSRKKLIEVVRGQQSDADLRLLETNLKKYSNTSLAATTVRDAGILVSYIDSFLTTLNTHLTSFRESAATIKAERDELRQEFGRYVEILETRAPLEAGMLWYQEKCEAYTAATGNKVMSPDDEVIYYDGAPDGDQGVYTPECFFPFYDFLNDEYSSYGPSAKFLAAMEASDNDEWHEGWEEELHDEELESFLEERAVSYEVDLEEYKEKYYDYDDDRDFRRYFEEDILPKKKAELIEEVIDETVAYIFEQYLDTYPEQSIKKTWQEMSEGYVGNVEVYRESNDYLDDEEHSQVSLVVDETYEQWTKPRRGKGWVHHVIPLDQYRLSREGRYGNIPYSYNLPNWWKLNTTPACSKPPVIKIDTRAIGWQAAFGIKPLIVKTPKL
jgi:hypothetical protein